MSDNNLDAEIQQWLEVVTKNPELAISPLESDVLKGDVGGHEFHGNQYSQGAGGATPPRRFDPDRYQHIDSEHRYGHPSMPDPDAKARFAADHGVKPETPPEPSVGHPFKGNEWVKPEDWSSAHATPDMNIGRGLMDSADSDNMADHHDQAAQDHIVASDDARDNGNEAEAQAHDSAAAAHIAAADAHRTASDVPAEWQEARQQSAERASREAEGATKLAYAFKKSVGDSTTDEIEEWDVAKGGEGSGEHYGHPFRGNKWTSVLFNAAAHNAHAEHRLTPMQAHLNDAIGHNNAAQQALHEGRFGDARKHFNWAAFHFGQVGRKSSQAGSARSQDVHQMAVKGMAAAHHAGDMAEYASLKVNDFARAIRQRNDDPTTLMALSGIAAAAQAKAHSAGSDVASITTQFSSMRLGDAISGAARAAAGQ